MAHGCGRNIFTELYCVSPGTILREMNRIRRDVRIFARTDGTIQRMITNITISQLCYV